MGFTVQQNGGLTNRSGWSNYVATITDDGTNQSVTVTPPNGSLYLSGNNFFRLSHP
jgi:hypothetical protein